MTAIPNTARELTLPSLYRRAALLLALATGIGAQPLPPQRIIQTFAGADFTFQGDGKPAITAPVGQMDGVAVDAAGNIYAADKENNIVFQVQLDGILKILAGNGFRGFGPDNVPARSSSLNAPISVAIGPDGSIYVADSGKIRRIGLDGIIKTVAGGGTNFPGDGSQATSVSLNTPTGIVFDAAGNLYFSDQNNQRVVKVTPAGVLTTIAGVGRRAGFSGDGGPGTAANLNFPYGLRFALDGSLLIADTENNRIRKLSLTTGIISTFAGGGNGGDGGPASQARITTPKALDIDRAGTIYILESVGLRVRRISPDGIITSVAGSGSIGFSGDGGPALSATLHWPQGMAVDRDGSILIADTVNRRIRRVSAGRIDTIVGNGTYRLTPDGTLASLSFFTLPTRVVTDTAGRVYVVDRDGALIRRIGADGKIVTIAGNGNQVASSSNGPVSATSIGIADLYGIAIDSNGNVFFVESLRIRRVTPEGVLTTFAGGGTNTGGDGGPATAVALNQPRDLAFDAAGNLYVSERTAHRIRKISPGGIISTVAGTSSAGFGGDGGQATQAQLNGPLGLALDSVNNLYIADPGNRRIRMVSPNGLISTVAGGGSTQRDGVPATQSSLNFPFGVVVDTAGSLYISDPFAQRIRVVNAEGRIDTFAGTGTAGFAGDGGPPQSASFRFNGGGAGIGLDRAGNLYIADTENFRIRVIPSATPTLDASTRSLSFTVRAGDAPPPPLQVTLTSSVLGLPFSIATSQPFLVATPTGLSAPSTLNITVNPATLNPGTSTGTVTITPSVAGVAPIVIAVTVTVQQPLTTRLSVDNTSLPYAFAKGAAPAARRLLVSNAGSAAESFTVIATTASGGN